MRTPMRPMPEVVERWMARARQLRWLDAAAGWLALWIALVSSPSNLSPAPAAMAAALALGILALVPPLRLRWRVISGAVGWWMSRALAVGDRAWWIVPGAAKRVIVTARHGARLTVATPGDDAAEGVSVRRTRVLLLPS